MAKRTRKITTFEIVWYSITGALALWGLTYTALGLVAENIKLPIEKNPLLQASNTIKSLFGLGFFHWGLIIFAIGVALAVIVLVSLAKNADRDFEKTQRRAARLARNSSDAVDAKVE